MNSAIKLIERGKQLREQFEALEQRQQLFSKRAREVIGPGKQRDSLQPELLAALASFPLFGELRLNLTAQCRKELEAAGLQEGQPIYILLLMGAALLASALSGQGSQFETQLLAFKSEDNEKIEQLIERIFSCAEELFDAVKHKLSQSEQRLDVACRNAQLTQRRLDASL
jgi:hypothetical protein